MKIFVTGALGFIGAHFAERALAAGHDIAGLYRSTNPAKRELLILLTRRGASLTQGDMLDANTYRDAMQGAECVCHFAAAFRGARYSEQDFQRLNVVGTETVLRTAAQANVRRFVLCSTAGIYGQQLPGLTNETATPRPWNAYERSKHAAEQRVRELAPKYGMEFVILRPTVVYGPRDERLLKLFRAAAKGQFPLFGSGLGRRHMVYVTDVADAFLLACTRPSARNRGMIIAGLEAVTLRKMLQMLASIVQRRSCGPHLPLAPMLLAAALVEDFCKLLGVSPPLYRRRMDFYRTDAAFDCTRARELLGWTPAVELREGLRRTYEATQDARIHNLGTGAARAP
ncbi:MAG TPA: NAD(P)-dependent oxidoreductase [Steroidobacteraceae bacterium]